MTSDRDGRQFRLLTIHYVLWSLGMSLACGFVDAYILRLGFGIPATLCLHASLLLLRFSIRAVVLPLIRRLGMRQAMLLGAAIAALQFLPLIRASQPAWLAAWIGIVSLGECIYWPIYHAANAVCGGADGRRGRQLALRQMASTATSIIGPVVGGLMLTRLGPAAEFGTASALTLASITPLFWMGPINLGRVPTMRESIRAADRVGMLAFAADGWISAGLGIAWPMILFTSLNSSYDALGWAGSAAAVAGALAGLGCGVAIDKGYRHRMARLITLGLLLGIAIRVASAWAPWAALLANVLAAAVGGLYVPTLMSVIYDRAKRSGSAYQFHLSAEAGWDTGCILGCIASAAVACTGIATTFSVVPAILGVVLLHRCIRAEPSQTPARAPALAGAVPALV
ncbi:MAG TPA: hypothetical protein VHO91_16210 [Rhodopila sp.]|nr:hypothetical protein [Rhodopila sp.]